MAEARVNGKVAVLGLFNADLTFSAARLPAMGETLLGEPLRMGPGGKASNQAIAAAKAGADVHFLTRIGTDPFAQIARTAWDEAGVDASAVIVDPDRPTGAAFIFVSSQTGDNAIIVASGAGSALSPRDVEDFAADIAKCCILMTQLEQPVDTAHAALARARSAGVATILNPAPAAELSDALLGEVDYLTPNESEAAALTGREVTTLEEAIAAADALLSRGVRQAVLLTLGERGALYHDGTASELVPALRVTGLVDTTGAGDAFNGAFATALAEGRPPLAAARFATAAAALSVTRAGASQAMPTRAEIDAALSELAA